MSSGAETKFIFITGGVVSSLGKGVIAASIGSLLISRGFNVKLRKFDPYLNVDPGTMNPVQHGEVFVTEDGAETDLDLGYYERFTGIKAESSDSVTAGKVYRELLTRERAGGYLGSTVQVIPHVTNIIREFISQHTAHTDFVICEIGGTVGDIEALPFLEAIRQMRYTLGAKSTMFVHVTLLPYLRAARELKTKPTQHSVKTLQSAGIQPDVILCRAERKIARQHLRKIANFCNLDAGFVMPAPDVDNIYRLPLMYNEAGLDDIILRHFALPTNEKANLSAWNQVVHCMDHPQESVNIAIVGKYTKLHDAYKSLIEALNHAGTVHRIKVCVRFVDSRTICVESLHGFDGIIVPGGFGSDGIDGKIQAIKFARENDVPFFGICLGMQLAVIEFARNRAGIDDASSSEFALESDNHIVSLVSEWQKGDQLVRPESGVMGGTMRLGGYRAELQQGSKVRGIYGADSIMERHRHRYEINPAYIKQLEGRGLVFSGFCQSSTLSLAEMIELPECRWFVGCQFHPELRSTPIKPHPLFVDFVREAARKKVGAGTPERN